MDLAALAQNLRRRRILYPVLGINLVGIAYGFFYYLPQFADTPVYLWPLVPDSPLAVLVMTAALVLVAGDRSNAWLNLLGSAAMVKVGLWTAVVLASFPQHFGFSLLPKLDCSTSLVFGCGNLNTILFYAHLGMAMEPLIVADQLPIDLKPYLAFGGLFALHDVIDYAWPVDYLARGCSGIFPHTVPCTNLGYTFLVTIGLSLAALAGLFALASQGSE